MASVADDEGVFDWWAHNGGKYDVSLLLDAIVRMGWRASGHIAAGRVVQLSVRVPGLSKPLRFFDSYAVVPTKLEDAAKDFELASRKLLTKDDYSRSVKTWSVKRLVDGCRADCEVVLDLLDAVEAQLDAWGGGLRSTFSGSALSIVESRVSLPDTRAWRVANEFARGAYLGGRVEVLHHSPREELSAWDVVSSYPWAMTQPLPFDAPRFVQSKEAAQLLKSGAGLVNATVTVPDMWLPPLPYSPPQGGVYFPTGSWRATFTAPELRYAKSLGVKVTPHMGLAFDEARPFADFIREVFEVKRTATGAKRTFAKLTLNGCYGKFGQKPEKENLIIFGSRLEALAFLDSPKAKGAKPLGEDERFVGQEFIRWSKRAHFALAATVTAHSRVLLHRALSEATRPAYCDTDSVHAATVSSFSQVGSGLGQLKLEVERMRGRYFAPKLYQLTAPTPVFKLRNPKTKELEPSREAFKSKGFPVAREAFLALTAGEAVTVERMQLARTQLRLNAKPSRVTEKRAWHGGSGKRRPLPDGTTHPWTVEELRAGLQLHAKSPRAPHDDEP